MKKVITFVFILILLVVNLNLLKGVYDDNKKLQTVNDQAVAVDKLKQTNNNLKEQLSQVNSPFYLEKEARNLLSYSKRGETTIVLGQGLLTDQNGKIQTKTNPEKWLDLLRNQH